MTLQISTPRWCLPLLEPKRYKGAKGGRASGKSHFFAESVVEAHLMNSDHRTVCVREIQKSLKFSAKKLIEDKIQSLGVSEHFDITQNEIRNKNGDGIIIFQGLQDHTADSIKSLEGFDTAWVEEAQSISKRSMELLLPTIRKDGSEIWFSWNPYLDDDPVEELFQHDSEDSILVHVNYKDNPFCSDEIKKEAERHRRNKPDTFDHVWLGGYATKSEAQIFRDRYEIREFETDPTYGEPLYGMDFGYSTDPTAAVELYIKNNILYIRKEAYKNALEIEDTAAYITEAIPNTSNYPVRADSARPEFISYLSRHGMGGIQGVDKWPGSIEDGVDYIKTFDRIVIHPDCEYTAQEFRLYSYKIDKRTGDILPKIEDKWNHLMDSIRYALVPFMRKNTYNYDELL